MRIVGKWVVLVTGVLSVMTALAQEVPAASGELVSRLVPGGFYLGQVQPGSQVFYQGRAVRVSSQGRFILGFGRDASLQQRYRLVPPGRPPEEVALVLKPRQYAIQRVNGVAKKYVQPAVAVSERIQRENRRIYAARQEDSAYSDFFSGFSWPASGPISGVYGSQRYFNGQPRRPHYGVDVAAPAGTPITAPADGVITLAESDLYFSGGTIIMDHGFGLSSSFLHLSQVTVTRGQRVKRGDTLGRVGATGRVTGAHLDWRINWFDQRLDPQQLTRTAKP